MLGETKTTVSDGFESLCRSVELSLVDYTAVSRYQADIEAYLSQYISTFTTILPGAYARHTMTAPLEGSVVDMFILFNAQHRTKFTPSVLIDKLLLTLRAEYPETYLNRKNVSLYVPVSNFTFRVQPGFVTSDNHYLVPGHVFDDWVEYDSLGYKHQFAKSNAAHEGKLIHVVRLMKSWNRESDNYFDGYFIELLVTRLLRNYTIDDYARALRHVFKYMVKMAAFKKHDPANTNLMVEGLVNVEDLAQSMISLHEAYRLVNQAIELDELGMTELAFTNWQKLFPDYFPLFCR